jgi:SAM-dependent methyltransferase
MLTRDEKEFLRGRDYWTPLKPLALFYQHQLEAAAARAFRRARLEPAGKRILEDGCGRGDFLLTLARFGAEPARCVGVDVNAADLARARERFAAAAFARADAAALPFKDGSFDLATAATLFSSLPPGEKRARAAAELMRALKPGGVLVWFDFVERNERTRGLELAEVKALFPGWEARARNFGLKFGWASLVVNKAMWLAHLLAALGVARSHWLVLLAKPK